MSPHLRKSLIAQIFILSCLAGRAMGEDKEYLIVCYGNSYTEGQGVRVFDAYPARLEGALKNVKVLNAGVSGETAGEGLERIEEDVLAKNPQLVLIEFGVNEAFRGYSVQESLDNLEKIVQKIRAKGIHALLVGVHFGHFQENFDEGLRKLSKKYQTGLVLNVLEGILDNPKLKSDAYHPNQDGYRIMMERILPEVKKFLDKGSPS